jgi:hypothetical protein
MQVTNEVWRSETQGDVSLALVLYTDNEISVTYAIGELQQHTQRVSHSEHFMGRTDGDEEVVRKSLDQLGYQLMLTSRFLV